jgi:hypothetical protein
MNATCFRKTVFAGLAGALLMLSDQAAAAEWPSIQEAEAIAEEGYIYGKPLVMTYAVMYAYAVDRNSGSHMYWPKTEPPSIQPIGKGTWKPPAVMVAT